jgi:nitrogen-specific signal transduction histidine kinase
MDELGTASDARLQILAENTPAYIFIFQGRRNVTLVYRAVEVINGDTDPENLFDAFYTTKSTGLGMGLSISRSIIRSHGGVIEAANGAHGRGTIVTFTLPVTVAEA